MLSTQHPFFSHLIKIIKDNIIILKEQELSNYYHKWSNEFYQSQGYYLNDKIQIGQISKSQNIPSDAELVGIDLPIFFGDYTKKRVMILGIDPLRSVKDFNLAQANIYSDVLLGTPYALHNISFREKRCSSYWNLVQILSQNNFVYVTDIFKSYFIVDNIRSYNYWYREENKHKIDNHAKLLLEEIKLINPDLIVSFGALAYNTLLNLDIKIPKLALMHLSRSARFKYLKRFIEGKYGFQYNIDNRVNAAGIYAQIVENNLNNLNVRIQR
jgi:hypothetical protein